METYSVWPIIDDTQQHKGGFAMKTTTMFLRRENSSVINGGSVYSIAYGDEPSEPVFYGFSYRPIPLGYRDVPFEGYGSLIDMFEYLGLREDGKLNSLDYLEAPRPYCTRWPRYRAKPGTELYVSQFTENGTGDQYLEVYGIPRDNG